MIYIVAIFSIHAYKGRPEERANKHTLEEKRKREGGKRARALQSRAKIFRSVNQTAEESFPRG